MDHRMAVGWCIQVHPVANIHLEALVDRELDKGLASYMMGSPLEADLVDSPHMLGVPQVEAFGFLPAAGAGIVSWCIHSPGFCEAMPVIQL
jgi:hypothetical protein